MRRVVMIAGVVGLSVAGCSQARDLFSARPNVVAEVGRQRLTAERLAQIIAKAPGLPVTKESAQFVANVWLDYAAFAQAVATGALKTDSATVAQVLWPQLAELKGSAWHDTVITRRAKVSPAQLDSLYNKTDTRTLQHILVRPQGNDAAAKAQARTKADSVLKVVRAGADFAQVASQVSEDPGSAAQGGMLPPSGKGAFVPAFEKAGWALAPGAVSGVVESPFGFHIIRRPTLSEVQPMLTRYLTQGQVRQIDSIYVDSLLKTKKVEVAPDAAAAIKTALGDPQGQKKSTKRVVTYASGALTVGEVLRWIDALPPQFVAQLQAADTTQLKQFARLLAQNVLMLQQADSAGIKVDPAQWKLLTQNLLSTIDSVKADMGLIGTGLTPEAAGDKMNAYFDRLVAGQARLRPLPATMMAMLREQTRARLNPAGIAKALELAQVERAKADSSRPRPDALQPAPGGPPVPGGQPATPPAGGQTPPPEKP
ncbi:MAG: peptidylprolyl isomerase [Gemmatimonadota bacterium]